MPVLGKIRLTALTGQHVQQMINGYAKTLSPRTVRYIRAVLRSALNRAMRWNLLVKNAACQVDIAPHQPFSFAEPPPESECGSEESTVAHRLGRFDQPFCGYRPQYLVVGSCGSRQINWLSTCRTAGGQQKKRAILLRSW